MAEIRVTRSGGIASVIFSNIEKHNAMTLEMWQSFPALLRALETDPVVRVIVLTGEGERAFVSGSDISQFDRERATEEARAAYNSAVEAAFEAPLRSAKPLVAKIRGICMGGGMGLAAACDLRICAEDAVFCTPGARLGIGYDLGTMRRLVEVMGPAHAADIVFSGRKFDARTALSLGLVNRVVAVDELDRETAQWCECVAENAPLTIAAAKATIRHVLRGADSPEGEVRELIARCFRSDDYVEGRRAFKEKRKPVFKGR